MNNQLFIHKYQPKFIDDFELDTCFKNVIETLIDINNLNILFVGNHGTGKSSLMFSIIRKYYNLDKDFSVLNQNTNILYINSLQEQGISYYRNNVKFFCQSASVIRGKKKIVIIDDIDSINEQSQQIFRNLIDKYSKNVHFIASCYNCQKVINNLQSRFNIIKIPPFTNIQLKNIITKIKTQESIDITEDAENFIVNISNNSIRVIINYMEKFKFYNKPITIHTAKKLCCNISFSYFQNYTKICKYENNRVKAIEVMNNIYDRGYSEIDILNNYFTYIKNTDILEEHEKYKIIELICKYITILNDIHENTIELAFFTNNVIKIFES